MNGTPEKLIILSYAGKENIISAPSSPAPMDTTGTRKQIKNPITTKKTSKRATSHHKPVLEVKTPPLKHYNKLLCT
ncbi:hypothetical protein H5410_018029 [Solanum commersonii]|uniref:Uncharacterized protein n=1 Tax=Solanum commersonii TaxID=4109 RepID=A0A9J6A0V0_SOLCO|nr:hypothetical protein H5410_018029 [Solanum commersonii]